MIDEKKLISHIEKQYREWGEEYDAMQILGDIEDFPKVDGWIPVEERLPDFGEIVFVTYIGLNSNKEFSGRMAFLNYNGDWYWNSDRYIAEIVRVKITAWMPLPEPYAKGAKKNERL